MTRSHVSAQVAEMKVFERKCAALMVNNNTQPRSISRSILNHLRVFAWSYNGRCSSKREPRWVDTYSEESDDARKAVKEGSIKIRGYIHFVAGSSRSD